MRQMRSKKKLWIIVGIVLLNSIGMSIVLPLFPFVLGRYMAREHVVVGMSALISVFAASTFLAAPVFGALSDRYGRKNVLIISLLGSVIGYVLFGLGGALWVLFLGRIIDGLTAGVITALFAYISDSTEPEERIKWYGYVGSAMGIGKLGGPALGGLLGSRAPGLPFFFTAALILLSALAVLFLLPESLPPSKRAKHLTLQSLNTFSHYREIFGYRQAKLLLIPGILFFAGLGTFQFNFTVFLKDVYRWGPAFIGSILTLAGVFEILSRAVLLPRLLKIFKEKQIGIAGLASLTSGLILILLSIFISSAIILSLAVVLILTGEGLFDPIFNGWLSRSVEESKLGQLQGVNQSLQSANNMLVPLLGAAVYFYSPAILYAAAAFVVVLAGLTLNRALSGINDPAGNPAKA